MVDFQKCMISPRSIAYIFKSAIYSAHVSPFLSAISLSWYAHPTNATVILRNQTI